MFSGLGYYNCSNVWGRHEKTREHASSARGKISKLREIIFQHYCYKLRQNCGNSFSTLKYKPLVIISTVEYFFLTRILGQA